MAIQVIVVGAGARGRDWVREIRNHAAFELSACVDSDSLVLERFARDLRVPRESCFTNLEDAIEKSRCRAVIVATPADRHVDPCKLALLCDLPVMVEKPFTTCLREAMRLVSMAEHKRVPLLVAQNYRYLRSFRTVRRLITEGALGEIGLVASQYYSPPHDMAASLARLQDSVLWGMAVHHLDALRHVLGREVVNVAAESFTLPTGHLPIGASFRAMLTFEHGPRALYSATYESSGHQFFERGQEFYTRFVGDRATLHVFHRWLILCENGKLPRIIRRGARKISEEQVLLGQFERAILQGVPPEVSGRDNLQTMALLEACHRSASEQKWINPQDLLHESQHQAARAGNRH